MLWLCPRRYLSVRRRRRRRFPPGLDSISPGGRLQAHPLAGTVTSGSRSPPGLRPARTALAPGLRPTARTAPPGTGTGSPPGLRPGRIGVDVRTAAAVAGRARPSLEGAAEAARARLAAAVLGAVGAVSRLQPLLFALPALLASTLTHEERHLELLLAALVTGDMVAAAQAAFRFALMFFTRVFGSAAPAIIPVGVDADVGSVTRLSTRVANVDLTLVKRASGEARAKDDVIQHLHALKEEHDSRRVLDTLDLEDRRIPFGNEKLLKLNVREVGVDVADDPLARVFGRSYVGSNCMLLGAEDYLVYLGICLRVLYSRCC